MYLTDIANLITAHMDKSYDSELNVNLPDKEYIFDGENKNDIVKAKCSSQAVILYDSKFKDIKKTLIYKYLTISLASLNIPINLLKETSSFEPTKNNLTTLMETILNLITNDYSLE